MRLDTVPDAITRLTDQLRAARAASPPSPLRRMMDNPSLYRRMRDEARQRARSSFPHLFDSDLLQRLMPTDIVVGDVQDTEPTERVKRKRRPTLSGIARQAKRAGIEVARFDFRPDGTISFATGKPDHVTTPDHNDSDEWDSVLQ